MSFRSRLVAAVTALTLMTLGGAFATVYVAVSRQLVRQLDEVVEAAARDDARAVASRGQLVSTPGPTTSHGVQLTRYEVLYHSGKPQTASAGFHRWPPERETLPPRQCCFDVKADVILRASIVPVPGRPGDELLVGLPRTDLDSDAALLRRTMLIVFGVVVAWTAALAGFIVARMTRGHRRITAVARRVAGGDMTARVGELPGAGEVNQLARDVDDMIERLSVLLASQQRFIAHAAHELRSPLAALYGELSLALRRERDTGEYRRAIEEALDSARRLKTLAEDLLTLARLGAGPPNSMQQHSVTGLLSEARRSLDSSKDCVIAVSGTCPDVKGSGGDLTRLFRNLLENAIRHSPPNETVRVELDARPGRAQIRVLDRGPGVRSGDDERIFDPFYRSADRASGGGGAGLGLSIARGIARAHGGELRYAPREGGGACFIVELPIE